MSTFFKPIFILVLLFSTTLLMAQDALVMVKSAETGKWGYSNLLGEFVIAPEHKTAFQFSESGYAVIKVKKQLMIIDRTGNHVLPESESVRFFGSGGGFGAVEFNDGLLVAGKREKRGFINASGEFLVEPQYESCTPFNNGFAAARKGEDWYVIDKDGNSNLVKGAIKVIKPFSEGLAPFHEVSKNAGFVDTKGEIVIRAKFGSVGYFKNGLAWARDLESNLLGFINKNGDWEIEPKFEKVNDFDEISGLARVRMNAVYRYVDKEGNLLDQKDSEVFGKFYDGLAKGRKNDKLGFYDASMSWKIEPKYDAVRDFKNGYAAVKIGDLWGIIDASGKMIVKPKFAGIKDVIVFK